MTEFIILLVLSYLSGSIPFGFLIAKYYGKIDIRQQGSGNIGATNVMRNLGKKMAIFTLIGDMLKGVMPVLIARYFTGDWSIIYWVALMAVIGHMFPVWLKFKGGKGVATGGAILLILSSKIGMMVIITWILTFVVYRISSLAALIATVLSPIYAYWLEYTQPDLPLFCLGLSLLIIIKHYQNIIRLFQGKEKKL